MPSVVLGLKGLLKGIGLIDDVVDTGRAVRGVKDAIGGAGGGDTVNLEKLRRLSAAIIEMIGGFLSRDKDGRKEFLSDERALRRVTEGFYERLPENEKDQYEKMKGEVWGAVCDGLGMRKQTQSEQKQEKGQQQQKKLPTPDVLRDITEMELQLAVSISWGKAALAADTDENGDAIIKRGIQRLRQASAGEKAGKAVKKGLGAFAELLETINDTVEEERS